jgi:hypothetical protein
VSNIDFFANVTRSIRAYDRHGESARDIIKKNHAVIFTGRRTPDPKHGEHGMLPPIRVKLRRRGDALDEMSRLDYGKVFTVEHNVKVYEIGMVDPIYKNRLELEFRHIFLQEPRSSFPLTELESKPYDEILGHSDEDNTSYYGDEEGDEHEGN